MRHVEMWAGGAVEKNKHDTNAWMRGMPEDPHFEVNIMESWPSEEMLEEMSCETVMFTWGFVYSTMKQ